MKAQWQQDLSSLYQRTRQESPPEELDRKIRNAAKKSITRKGGNLKWYLSSAAVVLLAVNVVLLIVDPLPEIVEMPQEIRSSPPVTQRLNSAPQASKPAPEVDVLEADNLQYSKKSIQSMAKKAEQADNDAGASVFESERSYSDSMPYAQREIIPESIQQEMREGRVTDLSIKLPTRLPFDLNQLMAGHSGLTGQQNADMLSIFRKGKLVLKMIKNQQDLTIEAYQGSDLWGIRTNWGQSISRDQECIKDDVVICSLNKEVTGGFKNDQLVFIRWTQKNE